MLTDPSQIPRDITISATPNGNNFYCTTPGGTRLVYDRSLLMKLSCSPMTKSPPSNMKLIPGVTSVGIASIPAQENLNKQRGHAKKTETDEQLFEMEF
jgi:hypothetical protein